MHVAIKSTRFSSATILRLLVTEPNGKGRPEATIFIKRWKLPGALPAYTRGGRIITSSIGLSLASSYNRRSASNLESAYAACGAGIDCSSKTSVACGVCEPFTPIELTKINRLTPLAKAALARATEPCTLIRRYSARGSDSELPRTWARPAKCMTTSTPCNAAPHASISDKSAISITSTPVQRPLLPFLTAATVS
ncbi:hypothetical protein ECAE60S_03927 [Eoetvoesiella caeni]